MRRLDGRVLAAVVVVAIAGAYWCGDYRARQAAVQAEADRYPWDLQRRVHDLEADLDCGTLRAAAQRAALVSRALDGGAVMAVIGYDMVTQQVSVTVVDRGQRVASDRRYLACP